MTDRTRVRIGRVMGGFAVVSAMAGCVWLVAAGGSERLMRDWVIHNAIVAVGFGLIVMLVIEAQPRNNLIWVLNWSAGFTGAFCLAVAASTQQLSELGVTDVVWSMTPAELPLSAAIVMNLVTWLYFPVFLAVSLAWLLFPDGRPPSPRWRWVAWLTVASIVVSMVGVMLAYLPSGEIPYEAATSTAGTFRDLGPVVGVAAYALIAVIPLCIAGLLVRFRRSTGQERMQFRWVVWAAIVLGVVLLPTILIGVVTREEYVRWPMAVGMVLLIAAYGMAIAKYRLYDVDLVISRTFVYGSLAVFITSVYVAIVVGVGYIVGAGEEPNPWLGMVATVVIAIAFQPLRRQLQRLANRIAYGRRATPYEVLSSFAHGISAVDDAVLGEIARSLGEGTTASAASIWLDLEEGARCLASWPEGDLAKPGEGAVSTPVTHEGERLGDVVLRVDPGRPFSDGDRRLLDQVAAGLGLALRNLLLTEDYRHRVEELAASRRRIVAIQDETRRRLERDLHDGAQQRLVALKIKLGIGSAMADKAGASDLKAIIDGIKDDADQTIESVRDFARGIYPPLLEAEGLAAALAGITRKAAVPVTVQAAGLERYSKEVEATVYFCVLEAVRNALEHGSARSVQVLLEESGDGVAFEVRDDGIGFDPASAPRSGLVNMVDRVEAIDGRLDVDSSPGHGARIAGWVPARALQLEAT